ncbi:SDR family NAD(P)-dependent oxidoreductase [Lichenicoccus roseus]|uniref:SDR family NAD(P)-dependent oxidoreductase n=1 Tax=Lichenicoccus roseus TaxID=2683649 RepID=UPI00197E65B2|nr:SDR family oxidoreductase [Lichenicoccus roseus]
MSITAEKKTILGSQGEQEVARDLEGKVVLITGASTGFGRGIASKMAEAGANIVNADLQEKANPSGFDQKPELTTVQLVQELGSEALFVTTNVTKRADVVGAVEATTERFGRLDILVNNAGIYRGGKLFHDFTEEELDICFDVNVRGCFLAAQEAIKVFLKQGGGGNIVNLVSTAGLQGHPRQSVYNISKGAAANLTRCLAIEYGREGIRVNGICPTYAKTALTRAFADDDTFDEMFTKSIPLGRWGEVSDVADLAVFLASDKSAYIHGDLIRVDGGETLCRYSV